MATKVEIQTPDGNKYIWIAENHLEQVILNLINNNKYTHPTTSGNKHIPAGGASGQILKWASDGTAQWKDSPKYEISDYDSQGLINNVKFKGSNNIVFAADCNTVANVQKKEITINGIDGDSLNSGTFLIVRFKNINSAENPTLSINGGTEKSLCYPYNPISILKAPATWDFANTTMILHYYNYDWQVIAQAPLPTELGGTGSCFGAGVKKVQLSNLNLDECLTPGWYYCSYNATNLPTETRYMSYMILIFTTGNRGSDAIVQVCIPVGQTSSGGVSYAYTLTQANQRMVYFRTGSLYHGSHSSTEGISNSVDTGIDSAYARWNTVGWQQFSFA